MYKANYGNNKGEKAIPIHTSTGVRLARPCAIAHPLHHKT
jgi:hypothetical protein